MVINSIYCQKKLERIKIFSDTKRQDKNMFSQIKEDTTKKMLYQKGDVITSSAEPYAFIISSTHLGRVCERCFEM